MGAFDLVRFRGVQNQTTQTPARSNKRAWWRRVYRSMRAQGCRIQQPNRAAQSWIFGDNHERTVYGPCGKLPGAKDGNK